MGITQERLAKTLRINQAGVSKIESRSDIFVSTLRKAIEAMVGKLEIRAKFPAGEVRIRHDKQTKVRLAVAINQIVQGQQLSQAAAARHSRREAGTARHQFHTDVHRSHDEHHF